MKHPGAEDLTGLQAEVRSVLSAAYPLLLTTAEVAERRTGRRYDRQESYRALRQLEVKGIVTSFRISSMCPVGWAVIR